VSVSRPDGKKLDLLWASVVKELQGYRCEYCGIRGRMEAAHVVGRRHRRTRWGLSLETISEPTARKLRLVTDCVLDYDLCGHCLCHRCHQEYDEHGPLEPKVIVKVIGSVRKPLLQRTAQQVVAKDQVYEEIERVLKEIREAGDDAPLCVR